MNSSKAWREKYRPRSFKDVVGQRAVVERLAALVHPRPGRNIILSGRSGSGKTTLAYAFAKAVTCFQPQPEGEPCGTCDSCLEWAEGQVGLIFEVDCPRHGTKEEVEAVLDSLVAHPLFTRAHVVFFDEAHDLSRPARDMLLKALEKARENLVFIFALLEAESLPVQLRDRCRGFELEPPSREERAEYLDRIIEAEQLACTPSARDLLIRHSLSFRALAGNAETLAIEAAAAGKEINDALVRSVLTRGGPAAVLDYIDAVTAGDLESQFRHMRSVRLNASRKARTVRDVLLHLKLRWIGPSLARGVEVPFEGLLDPQICGRIAQTLAERAEWLGISDMSLFDQILDFWSFWPAEISEEELEVQMVRFHDRLASSIRPTGAIPDSADIARLRKAAPPPPARPRLHRSLALAGKDRRDAHLSGQQVQEIYEAATFMIQRYGLFFNTSIELDEATICCSEAQGYTAQTSEFLRELGQNFGRWAKAENLPAVQCEFHRIALHERNDRGMLCTRIVFYSPEELASRLTRWFAQYLARRNHGRAAPAVGRIDHADSRKAAGRNERHWHLVRDLWRGTDPAVAIGGTALIERLGIVPSRRRPAGAISSRRFAIGRSLSSASQLEEAGDYAPHLSAFGDQAWDWLFRGWEWKVHLEREERREAHRRALAALEEDIRGQIDSLTHQNLASQRETLVKIFNDFRYIRQIPWGETAS